MDDKLNELFNIYKKFLLNDKIIIINDKYSFSILKTGRINHFQIFLEENKQYFNSKKYLYIKCLYLYLKKEYNKIFNYIDILIDEPNYLDFIGWYYQNIEKNYYLMKKYYLMAIELGNYHTMNNLGYYYQYTEENYDLMKKYYLMAIQLNYGIAMNNLGSYYHKIEKNYNLMKKYFMMMTVELNDPIVINNLSFYYQNIDINYDLMKKYYIMAIELNNDDAIYDLKLYCETVENNESNYYKYVYYPRILTLILCNRKLHNKSFLPEELLNQIIFTDYILDSK